MGFGRSTVGILLVAAFLILGGQGPAARADESGEKVPEDVADVPSKELHAGKDEDKRYFLIGETDKPPKGGYGLAIVMPGGSGEAGFNAFVRRMYKHAFKQQGYVVAQLVAKKWTPTQQIVWPTAKNKVAKMGFSTEAFVEAVIKDVRSTCKVDKQRIFTLSWSSSGPAAYAISLTSKRVRGSYIAMSVFKPDTLPSLEKARGHAYYLLHSPDDKVCPYRMAEASKKALTKAGAEVTLVDYAGGHGWRMAVYPALRKGFEWLEAKRRK